MNRTEKLNLASMETVAAHLGVTVERVRKWQNEEEEIPVEYEATLRDAAEGHQIVIEGRLWEADNPLSRRAARPGQLAFLKWYPHYRYPDRPRNGDSFFFDQMTKMKDDPSTHPALVAKAVERCGSQKVLARRARVSPALVTKWLGGAELDRVSFFVVAETWWIGTVLEMVRRELDSEQGERACISRERLASVKLELAGYATGVDWPDDLVDGLSEVLNVLNS